MNARAVQSLLNALHPEEWVGHALCGKMNPDIFYPEEESTIRGNGVTKPPTPVLRAKNICYRCPVRKECLEDAYNDPHIYGKWVGIRAGLTGPERRRLVDQPDRTELAWDLLQLQIRQFGIPTKEVA